MVFVLMIYKTDTRLEIKYRTGFSCTFLEGFEIP
jgi:hypothetical protein